MSGKPPEEKDKVAGINSDDLETLIGLLLKKFKAGRKGSKDEADLKKEVFGLFSLTESSKRIDEKDKDKAVEALMREYDNLKTAGITIEDAEDEDITRRNIRRVLGESIGMPIGTVRPGVDLGAREEPEQEYDFTSRELVTYRFGRKIGAVEEILTPPVVKVEKVEFEEEDGKVETEYVVKKPSLDPKTRKLVGTGEPTLICDIKGAEHKGGMMSFVQAIRGMFETIRMQEGYIQGGGQGERRGEEISKVDVRKVTGVVESILGHVVDLSKLTLFEGETAESVLRLTLRQDGVMIKRAKKKGTNLEFNVNTALQIMQAFNENGSSKRRAQSDQLKSFLSREIVNFLAGETGATREEQLQGIKKLKERGLIDADIANNTMQKVLDNTISFPVEADKEKRKSIFKALVQGGNEVRLSRDYVIGKLGEEGTAIVKGDKVQDSFMAVLGEFAYQVSFSHHEHFMTTGKETPYHNPFILFTDIYDHWWRRFHGTAVPEIQTSDKKLVEPYRIRRVHDFQDSLDKYGRPNSQGPGSRMDKWAIIRWLAHEMVNTSRDLIPREFDMDTVSGHLFELNRALFDRLGNKIIIEQGCDPLYARVLNYGDRIRDEEMKDFQPQGVPSMLVNLMGQLRKSGDQYIEGYTQYNGGIRIADVLDDAETEVLLGTPRISEIELLYEGQRRNLLRVLNMGRGRLPQLKNLEQITDDDIRDEYGALKLDVANAAGVSRSELEARLYDEKLSKALLGAVNRKTKARSRYNGENLARVSQIIEDDMTDEVLADTQAVRADVALSKIRGTNGLVRRTLDIIGEGTTYNLDELAIIDAKEDDQKKFIIEKIKSGDSEFNKKVLEEVNEDRKIESADSIKEEYLTTGVLKDLLLDKKSILDKIKSGDEEFRKKALEAVNKDREVKSADKIEERFLTADMLKELLLDHEKLEDRIVKLVLDKIKSGDEEFKKRALYAVNRHRREKTKGSDEEKKELFMLGSADEIDKTDLTEGALNELGLDARGTIMAAKTVKGVLDAVNKGRAKEEEITDASSIRREDVTEEVMKKTDLDRHSLMLRLAKSKLMADEREGVMIYMQIVLRASYLSDDPDMRLRWRNALTETQLEEQSGVYAGNYIGNNILGYETLMLRDDKERKLKVHWEKSQTEDDRRREEGRIRLYADAILHLTEEEKQDIWQAVINSTGYNFIASPEAEDATFKVQVKKKVDAIKDQKGVKEILKKIGAYTDEKSPLIETLVYTVLNIEQSSSEVIRTMVDDEFREGEASSLELKTVGFTYHPAKVIKAIKVSALEATPIGLEDEEGRKRALQILRMFSPQFKNIRQHYMKDNPYDVSKEELYTNWGSAKDGWATANKDWKDLKTQMYEALFGDKPFKPASGDTADLRRIGNHHEVREGPFTEVQKREFVDQMCAFFVSVDTSVNNQMRMREEAVRKALNEDTSGPLITKDTTYSTITTGIENGTISLRELTKGEVGAREETVIWPGVEITSKNPDYTKAIMHIMENAYAREFILATARYQTAHKQLMEMRNSGNYDAAEVGKILRSNKLQDSEEYEIHRMYSVEGTYNQDDMDSMIAKLASTRDAALRLTARRYGVGRFSPDSEEWGKEKRIEMEAFMMNFVDGLICEYQGNLEGKDGAETKFIKAYGEAKKLIPFGEERTSEMDPRVFTARAIARTNVAIAESQTDREKRKERLYKAQKHYYAALIASIGENPEYMTSEKPKEWKDVWRGFEWPPIRFERFEEYLFHRFGWGYGGYRKYTASMDQMREDGDGLAMLGIANTMLDLNEESRIASVKNGSRKRFLDWTRGGVGASIVAGGLAAAGVPFVGLLAAVGLPISVATLGVVMLADRRDNAARWAEDGEYVESQREYDDPYLGWYNHKRADYLKGTAYIKLGDTSWFEFLKETLPWYRTREAAQKFYIPAAEALDDLIQRENEMQKFQIKGYLPSPPSMTGYVEVEPERRILIRAAALKEEALLKAGLFGKAGKIAVYEPTNTDQTPAEDLYDMASLRDKIEANSWWAKVVNGVYVVFRKSRQVVINRMRDEMERTKAEEKPTYDDIGVAVKLGASRLIKQYAKGGDESKAEQFLDDAKTTAMKGFVGPTRSNGLRQAHRVLLEMMMYDDTEEGEKKKRQQIDSGRHLW
ncbi:MAG: hypothetical protein V1744_00690 [Candidatus Altiarchaeota archaeon]